MFKFSNLEYIIFSIIFITTSLVTTPQKWATIKILVDHKNVEKLFSLINVKIPCEYCVICFVSIFVML